MKRLISTFLRVFQYSEITFLKFLLLVAFRKSLIYSMCAYVVSSLTPYIAIINQAKAVLKEVFMKRCEDFHCSQPHISIFIAVVGHYNFIWTIEITF